MRDLRGLLLIVFAAALWGTTGTAQALGPDGSDPIGVGLMRLVVAAPALLAIAAAGRRLPALRRHNRGPVLLAGVAMAAYQPFFFTAVEMTGVAVGTLVAIGSAPVLAGLIGWVVDGESPLRAWWLATALGVAGVGLIAIPVGQASADFRGVLAALGAGLAFAIYIAASRRVVGLSDPVGSTALVFALAAVVSAPLFIWVDLGWLASGPGVAMTLHLGIVATAAAYVLFATGLRTTAAAPAATASLTEPLTAGALGVVVLSEMPGAPAWVGMILIVGGLGVLASGPAVAKRARTDRLPAKGWP